MTEIVEADPQVARNTGRPRSEGCRQKILSAADTLLERDSFARMSVDAIAQLAGVSKATIYRWWPNKAAIVMEALLASTEADIHVAESAFPEGDLIARIRRTIGLFHGPKGRVLSSLIAEAQFDPELAEAYRQRLLGPRRTAVRNAIERMIAIGRLDPDLDMDMAIDLLLGPLYQRLLLGHAPLDDAFARDYPAKAVRALRAFAGEH
jgi:AcrR family transcriptional regulator